MTDKQLLDWLESKSETQAWIARRSFMGRGYRLHNITKSELELWPLARKTAREAIEAAMLAELDL